MLKKSALTVSTYISVHNNNLRVNNLQYKRLTICSVCFTQLFLFTFCSVYSLSILARTSLKQACYASQISTLFCLLNSTNSSCIHTHAMYTDIDTLSLA